MGLGRLSNWKQKPVRWIAACSLAIAAFVAGKAWADTMVDPVVKRLTIQSAELSGSQSTIRILLMADIHVAGPDMPPERLKRIVAQANALEPDVVLIAGDFVSDKRTATQHFPAKEAIEPLAQLSAPLGKIAVPGNHDHWRDLPGISRELSAAGFTVLRNQAVRVGPIALGGLDDDFTGRADLDKTLSELSSLNGPKIILSHSPDPTAQLPADTGTVLAGHTHCGQLRYPWGGSPATMSDYGDRFACGVVRERGNLLVTTGGLGTSVLPFRFFTQPEIWLITIRPPNP